MSTTRAPLAVLVVDDEQRSLETLKRTLDDYFTVFTAISAEVELNAVVERAIHWVQKARHPILKFTGHAPRTAMSTAMPGSCCK